MNGDGPGEVIFVDDDPVIRAATVQSLQLAGLPVRAFESAHDALDSIDRQFRGVVVTDIRMPDIDGLQFFKMVHERDPAIPVILITGHGDVPMAVTALRDGADDFITKPFASDHLVASIQRSIERRALELDNRALRATLEDMQRQTSPLVGESGAIVRLREAIAQVADSDLDVLIEGETGVGKELVALLLHRGSRRRTHRFVNVNCATLSPGTATARLFGDGARSAQGGPAQPSLVETAHRGTLFLDEIDHLELDAQPLMLRVLEERQIPAMGTQMPVPVDLRVIAASRRDIGEAVSSGGFRADLYYALNIVRLRIPPLRERRSDIPLLFAHFIDEAATQMRRQPPRMTDRTRRRLIDHDWPGNVRELRSFAFQTLVGFEDGTAGPDAETFISLPDRVDRFEASAICSALEESGGNASEAMRRLGLPRKTFYDKLQRHKIDLAAYRK